MASPKLIVKCGNFLENPLANVSPVLISSKDIGGKY
jgi:hypothetical protein